MHRLDRTVLAALLVAALLGIALLAAVGAWGVGRTAPALAVGGGCPRHVTPAITFGPARWIVVLRAVRTQVPRVFADLTSMGHPAWQRVQVQALVGLNQLPLGTYTRPAVRGLDRYERFAIRACGRSTAGASVLVFLQFPNCQLPCSFGWAYVTPTRAGWHLWTSYRG